LAERGATISPFPASSTGPVVRWLTIYGSRTNTQLRAEIADFLGRLVMEFFEPEAKASGP
jgi:hypothetical protein